MAVINDAHINFPDESVLEEIQKFLNKYLIYQKNNYIVFMWTLRIGLSIIVKFFTIIIPYITKGMVL
ncbi:hypothetical protein AML91_13680 [Paenibacillus jilunlii]|uniref:Uncharacterized protein n=1 Tax=Paenibacillus jilunlii TaxID=682956 RepID=A0ABR5SYP4_9BACL|nr:hypothetical protein AML91_13680 [Paenibacillus jilunlii]